MSKNSIKSVEEKILLKNALKTSMYFLNALVDEDFDSANLEIEELKCVVRLLEDNKIKRDRREILLNLVVDMKNRGINIDFAKRDHFFEKTAKNDVETNRNNSKIHKKKQQA
jgi:hypothetical protein